MIDCVIRGSIKPVKTASTPRQIVKYFLVIHGFIMNNSIRKAVSTTIVVIIVVILVIAAGVGVYFATATSKSTTTMMTTSTATSAYQGCNTSQLVFCFPTIPKPSNNTISAGQKITIGVLTDETSELAGIGVGIGYAAELGAANFDTWLHTNDPSWGSVNFTTDVLNYALNSQTAMTDSSTLQTAGVSVAIGPLDSGTLGAIYSTAER